MRILFISHSFNQGGAQKSLFEVVSFCIEKGDECLVVGPREGTKIKEYRDAGIRFVQIRLGSLFTGQGVLWRVKKALQLIVNVLQIIVQIRRFKPDVVYTNTSSVLAGAIAAKLTGTPHIWHVRENFKTFPGDYIIGPEMLGRIMKLLSDRIIFVSSLAKHALYPDDCEKAVVIHNGIDCDKFANNRARSKHTKKENGSFNIGFVGGISHRRGLDILFESLSISKRKYDTLFLEVWGNGDRTYERRLRKLALSLGISEQVFFKGYAQNVSEILPAYNIIAIPSRSEACSRIMLETMAARVPLIVTSCGCEEMVEDGVTGRIVPVGDSKALAEAINWVLEDPLRAGKMAARAQKKVQQDFRLEDKLNDIRKVISDAKAISANGEFGKYRR